MTVGVFISTVLWIMTIAGFLVWNLYQKNKKMEEIIEYQNFYVQSINSIRAELELVIHKMDSTMWVQSDPELIQLFEAIKNISEAIKRFNTSDGI